MELSSIVDKERYQRLVDKPVYLSHACLVIASAISIVSQLMHSPTQECFKVVYQVLEYPKGSLRKGLLFGKKGNRQG